MLIVLCGVLSGGSSVQCGCSVAEVGCAGLMLSPLDPELDSACEAGQCCNMLIATNWKGLLILRTPFLIAS